MGLGDQHGIVMLVTGRAAAKKLEVFVLVVRDPMDRTWRNGDRITLTNPENLPAAVHHPLALSQKINLLRLGMVMRVGGRPRRNGRLCQALMANGRIPMSQYLTDYRPVLGHKRFAVGQGDKQRFHGFCIEERGAFRRIDPPIILFRPDGRLPTNCIQPHVLYERCHSEHYDSRALLGFGVRDCLELQHTYQPLRPQGIRGFLFPILSPHHHHHDQTSCSYLRHHPA